MNLYTWFRRQLFLARQREQMECEYALALHRWQDFADRFRLARAA